ncbi:hypothetical protein BDR07DRAFT_1422706 [Suillus spraguei]|nr:hypothetical protein BDR07DRAFT_1422706 [Suillus spraguei]
MQFVNVLISKVSLSRARLIKKGRVHCRKKILNRVVVLLTAYKDDDILLTHQGQLGECGTPLFNQHKYPYEQQPRNQQRHSVLAHAPAIILQKRRNSTLIADVNLTTIR